MILPIPMLLILIFRSSFRISLFFLCTTLPLLEDSFSVRNVPLILEKKSSMNVRQMTNFLPSQGYLNEGKLSQEFPITENGKILDLTAKETAISNQVIRGDLEFVKVSDGDLNRLANVPFSITSKTTGESHTIVTDKNGYASTSSEWNKHTTNTNRGETSEDGIWFGSSKPDDAKGALIYDTYILEEQRCDSNEGMNLLKIEVSVYKNHVVVDMGTLTDDQITIGTTALDKDSNSHFAKPEEKITLVDTVEYEGLKKGQSYKLIGTLMDQESGKPIEIDGKPVTAETTFKPKKSSGSAKVTFTFNASSLKGKTIVVFEELYQEDLKLAVHADITDQDQTIYFPEIGTTAKDKETDMNLSQADKEVTLVDTVAYKNLLPGEEYVMTGTLIPLPPYPLYSKVKVADFLNVCISFMPGMLPISSFSLSLRGFPEYNNSVGSLSDFIYIL